MDIKRRSDAKRNIDLNARARRINYDRISSFK